MRLLLDTHTVIFSVDHREQLSPRVVEALLDPSVERWVSTVSLWEIAIKIRIGKLQMPTNRDYYYRHLQFLQAQLLPVELRHTLRLMELPLIHRDPFDRLLVAQALEDNLTLATRDSLLAGYQVATIW